ncbi:MAG TPA: hypothetical protein VF974_04720 [Patescibacteria group bacterium]
MDNRKLIKDKFGNDGIWLSKYEAGNIRVLLQALYELHIAGIDSGDWFNDLRKWYIPEDWYGNSSVESIKEKILYHFNKP